MRLKTSTCLIFGLILCQSLAMFPLMAQPFINADPLWTPIEATAISLEENQERQIIPQKHQTFKMDEGQMRQVLSTAPMRFSPASRNTEVVLTLPMPDGAFQQFSIQEAPVMHPNLAARYPSIRSYWGKGLYDPTAYLRFDLTPHGFHAMVLTGQTSTVFIDPYAKNDTEHYIAYYKKDYQKSRDFVCGVGGTGLEENENHDPNHSDNLNPMVGDCQLRVYRLALACVGEYGQFHGGTVEGALAAMATTMARVNGVYERDLGVTMVLVENNDQLVFLNPATDPYSNSFGDLGPNQATCANVIGLANFDIGHLLTTGGGGVAMLNSPCVNNQKARGLSGQGAPVGDPYDIDYVAHEMGHQFGGNHTQNNSCNRNGSTAAEPGSASTIMGYAGICSPNVQSNSDDHFHAINLNEMAINITVGNSSTCPTVIDTGNNPPEIDNQQTYVLPVLTPFTLTAVANDPDGDSLTYCWEQMDTQVAPMPPQPTSTSGPAFRSMSPSPSPSRTFPNTEDLNNNIDPVWEELPEVTRNMRFRCTVRDNFMGAGCTDETDVTLTFRDEAGPFLVLEPNTAVTWLVGDFAPVNWDVANTDIAPINCTEVDILLSTDGGLTYPIVLAENVPNNGELLIEVPDAVGENSRVKVVCADNIFFDISNTDFIIEAPTEPGIAIYVDPPTQEFCGNIEQVELNVSINSLAGFDELVNLSVEGLPMAADVSFSSSPQFTPPGNISIIINNPSVFSEGLLAVTVNVEGATATAFETVELLAIPDVPEAPQLSLPTNLAIDISREPTLVWDAAEFTISQRLEIATNPSFANGTIVEEATVLSNQYEPTGLQYFTVYYWRVYSTNLCGESVASEVFSFQTVNPGCEIIESTDIPLDIPSSNIGVFQSTIEIPDDRNILDLNLRMSLSHLEVDDLIAELINPAGDKLTLFSQTENCNTVNLSLLFDDSAINPPEALILSCNSGSFQPSDPFATWNDTNAKGTWTLAMSDVSFSDGGMVNTWSLEICTEATPLPGIQLTNQILAVQEGNSETIGNTFLNANTNGVAEDEMTYTLLSLPQNGALAIDGEVATIGSTFSQADIDEGKLVYTHDGSDTTNDAFDFDVLNQAGTWSNGHTFQIVIFDQALSAVPFIDFEVSCVGAMDAMVSINATGGMAPYEYSIDGTSFQANNAFNGLAAGTYNFVVMDAMGNEFTLPALTINDPAALEAQVAVDGNQATILASGGTGLLMYSIDGNTYQSDNVFADLLDGDYTAFILDANDCMTMIDFTILTTSTDELDQQLSFEINPNPTRGHFQLKLAQELNGEVQVSIFDLVGKQIRRQRFATSGGQLEQNIDISNLASGVYVLTVNSGLRIGAKRVVLVK